MTSDIQTIRASKAYGEPVLRRPGHPDQDFESLLRRKTETYRSEKAKTDSSESRLVKKDSNDSIENDIPEDIPENIASLEADKTGRSSDLKEDGQEGTEKEKDISVAGYLIHDPSRQQAAASLALASASGQADEDFVAAGGQTGAVPLLEAGPVDPMQRMYDDVVKEIPTLSEDKLHRMEDPAEVVKAQPQQEGTGQAGTAKLGMREPFLKSIQGAELKADSLKDDNLKKEVLKPENLSRIAEAMKNLEKAGSVSQNPMETMETMETMDKIRNLILTGKTREEDGHETSDKDAGIEALKGLSASVKTGEARLVKEAQKPEGQMAVDRNLEMAVMEIVHQVETLKDGERTTIRVRLYPEEIGEMEITLSMEEGKLSGKILVENKEMRQVFTERLSDLNQTLKACHIDVAKFEVGIGAGQQQGQAGHREQRQTAYPERFRRYSAETMDREEIGKTVRTAARGIDLLA